MSALPPGCLLTGCEPDLFAYGVAPCDDGAARPPIIGDQFACACLGNPAAFALHVDSSLTWEFEVVGTLPAGMTLSTIDAQHALISGTPVAIGNYSFMVQATNGWGTATGPAAFGLLVFEITTSSLPDYTPYTPYSAALAASGGSGTYVWTLVSGSLPSDLTLGSDGVISGVPTEPGDFSITVRCQDAACPNGTGCEVELSLHGEDAGGGDLPGVPPHDLLPQWPPAEPPVCDASGSFQGTWVFDEVSGEVGTGAVPPFVEVDPAVLTAWALDVWSQFSAYAVANAGTFTITEAQILWWYSPGPERFLAQFVYEDPPGYTMAFGYDYVLLILFCYEPV